MKFRVKGTETVETVDIGIVEKNGDVEVFAERGETHATIGWIRKDGVFDKSFSNSYELKGLGFQCDNHGIIVAVGKEQ